MSNPVFDVECRDNEGNTWTVRVIATTPTKAKRYAQEGIRRVHKREVRARARVAGTTDAPATQIIGWHRWADDPPADTPNGPSNAGGISGGNR